MCGIAGVHRPAPGGDDEPVVRRMLERLVPRGPDGDGLVRAGPVTLGHRRLAILDLSDAARQPMESASGRFVVTFNGEIYNFRELREELGVAAAELRSSSDTEVLLLAWERWGKAALERLAGQFAFALFDREERRLWLARDRFGEKPLFYHRGPHGLLAFASSVLALVQAPWIPREIDREALVEYLTLRYVVAPRTVFAGIRKLPAGHLLCAGPEGVSIERWYEPRYRSAPARPRAELVEEFGALLVQAARRCLVSDVPVAILLSDGIDSHSIRRAVALAGRDIPAFTFRLSDQPSGVARPAPGEAAHTTDLVVTPRERLDALAPALGSMTEPVGDGAALATWLLIRRAREHATVFLCGHGADEVLGGYRLSQDRFRLAALRRLARLPPAWSAPPLERFLYGAEPLAERRARLLALPPRRAPEAARYLIQRPLPQRDVARILGDGAPDGYLGVVDALYAECAEGASDLDRMQEVMLRTFLSENVLAYADSVSMASSAELRLPFLDRDLVDFALALAPGARVGRFPGRANTKQVLRWWGAGRLSRGIVRRRKRTFQFGALTPLLREHGAEVRSFVLDAPAVRAALPGVESWLAQPPERFRGPWEGTLWALLALGIFCETAGVRA